jgi:preprotein translocase subunit SecD
MFHYPTWKIAAIVGACLLGIVYALPNMLPQRVLDALPSWWPKRTLVLGLDLRGGSHLLIEADTQRLRRDWLDAIVEDARSRLRDASLGRIGYAVFGRTGDLVRVRLTNPADMDKALERLRGMIQPVANSLLGMGSDPDLEVVSAGPDTITIRPTDLAFKARIGHGLGSAMEIIRNRIDQLGTTEPLVQRQGENRILVQVPGYDDPERLKNIIRDTAKLTFHAVDLSKSVADAEATGVPPDSKIYEFRDRDEGRILLHKVPVVDGEDLVDAQQSFDSRTGEPVVAFRFNTKGAKRFARYTQENVGRPFAIVLDDKVITAPNILEPILSGSGQISGNFTVESANDLAIKLRSGALPTDLTVVEERSVGPSLGADSIASGIKAGIIGSIASAIFAVVVYGLFGAFAVFALALNGLILVGVMSALQGTLTLPGIAGIVLTIGMAVDANVLIFERIKEELRAGKTAIAAIQQGFDRAIITIADSQLTTLAAALVMFWLGSGPVRGFAVTLSIGVATSVFTAITVMRLIISLWLRRARKTQRVIEVPV